MKIADSKKKSNNAMLANQLKKAMGANARRIRLAAGASLEDVAEAIGNQGLNWSTGRVGDLEGGRVEAKLSNALAVAQTLANVTGEPVSVADLFAGTEFEALLRGEPMRPQPNNGEDPDPTPTDIARRNGWADLVSAASDFGVSTRAVVPLLVAFDSIKRADRRVADGLGISLVELTEHAVALWGHSLITERDRVAEPDANVARLGQLTRELRDQIEARL
ncbi:MAG: helix-turn-helix transcriptional regulator [Gordonia sp. (in: high G+C Gram-positive bacteria)]|uniref:helix-turn-helix domain-containing protein n=1 Tax=Gordonia sp. (in: high G+C Gram-positive bacteria) TaxID=84139 RepID=UPI003C71CF61